MLKFQSLNRLVQKKSIRPTTYNVVLKTYSKNNDNKEIEKKINIKNEKNSKSDDALKKLNVLLTQIIKDNNDTKDSKLNLARPKSKIRNDKVEPSISSVKNEEIEEKIVLAAKNVAQSMGGNTKQTESELLSKLLNTTSISKENEQNNKPLNLSDVISGMKIDRTVKQPVSNEVSRAHQVRQLLDRTTGKRYEGDIRKRPTDKMISPKFIPYSEREKVDLFGGKKLGIFTSKEEENAIEQEEKVSLKIWKTLQERELQLAVTHPPENYFQEMILWTKQGKVWKFPVDNEQGMEEEQNVYFAEHIFLDKHLENWCPTKGPVRHFMELVCVGLSKNPYLSSQAKKDHIMWFKDYFLSKKQLLEEIGAMPTNANITKEIQQ